jgi:hypothetical protein
VPKGSSEGLFREALNKIDFDPTFIFKPPDDARNWKPADYFLWFPVSFGAPAGSSWFEVKETPNLKTFPLAEIRPSQWRGIATAKRLRLPYFLAIRWKRDGMWSLVDAVRLIVWIEAQQMRPASVDRVALESRFGVSSTVGQLPMMIRAALTEGL